MSTSMDYWNVVTAVQSHLNNLAATGNEMHSALESNDDPGEAAEFLADIEKRLTDLAAQVGPNVPALRKLAKALDDVPGIR